MKKPNILLLTADQQRYDTICCVNAPFMKTPSLDRLCREGVCFTNAYSPNPVCIPARHNILTGLPARYHNLPSNVLRPLPRHLPSLPRILSEHGYATAAVGKMHFHPVRAHHGFHHMRLMEEIPAHRDDDEYLKYLGTTKYKDLLHLHGVRHTGYQQPQRSLLDDAHHGSTWVAEETCRHIAVNRDRPWFIWSSWIQPHPPANVSSRFADMYRRADLPALRGNAVETPELRRFRELYYAAISQVDKNVGTVLDALDEFGLADNTLVIYTSDHGEMLGDLRLRTKELPYDSSSRIPFIVRYPGAVTAGKRSDEFVDLNDILPTALDGAGIDIGAAANAHGIESFPGDSLIHPRGARDRSGQYAEYSDKANRWIMYRDRRWKYIYFFGDGSEEFYDMETDAHETHSLAESENPEHRTAFAKLKAKALEHETRWGLASSVKNGALVSYDRPFDKARYAADTPVWSVKQWPAFTEQWDERTVRQMEREIEAVVKHEPLGREARARMTDDLKKVWHDEWNRRNGTGGMYARLYGEKRIAERMKI